MKLVIEYDPFGETSAAQSAQKAFQILGIPVELRDLRELKFNASRAGKITPVKFEEPNKDAATPS